MHARSLTLDWLRTIAIVLMVIYHGLYDLSMQGFGSDLDRPMPWLIARMSLILFLAVSGATFAARSARGWPTRKARWLWVLKRTVTLAACAGLISLTTYVMDPGTYVRFGVLHLLACSTVILALTYRLLPNVEGFLALLLLATGSLFPHASESAWLLPFGLMPPHFASVDYVPLLPWIGVVLMAHALWSFVPQWMKVDRPATPYEHVFTWPGRNALLVYVLHQPLLFGFFWLMRILPW